MRGRWNDSKPLSQLLKEYYRLEGDNISTSIDARWRTFANDFQIGFHNLGRIEGTFNVDKLTESEKNAWISRINNFNKLFGDGGIAAISGFQRSPLRSDYTNDMFERFTVYVREKLDNQKKL
jgi:hypothetical protein